MQRPTSRSSYYDAMGCYPLFVCRDWSQLSKDLSELEGELVSVSVVTDPFGEYDSTYLRECFHDVVLAFKEHFVIDLGREMDAYVSDHHRRNARRGFQKLRVELCESPKEFVREWIELYSTLISRHNIVGVAAFSPAALAKQLEVPGIAMFRAVYGDATVGITLWYIQDGRAYYHLGAYSEKGYDLRASFALFWFAIEHFTNADLHWLSLGAGAGVRSSADDGLTRFKRGWSNGTRTAYFCGRILDRGKYLSLKKSTGALSSDHFPAYRSGEFG